LFSRKKIGPRAHLDFLRIAFLDVVQNYWERGIADHKFMQDLRGERIKRFLTRTELARQLGIDTRSTARLLRETRGPIRRLGYGKMERIIVDCGEMDLHTYPGKIYQIGTAAAIIGLPVRVLSALRRSGIYGVTHTHKTKRGFHQLDVEAFRDKLLALRSPADSGDVPMHDCVTVGRALRGRYGSREGHASVVRALLSRDLPVIGNLDGTVRGMIVPSKKFEHFAQQERARATGNARSCAEVGRELNTDCLAIPGLIELGLLRGKQMPNGLRVTEESIAEFKRQYVAVAVIAKTLGTTSCALMRYCEEKNIFMLVVRWKGDGRRRLFVRLEDKPRLLSFQRFRGSS
jgi:hypothetical protein